MNNYSLNEHYLLNKAKPISSVFHRKERDRLIRKTDILNAAEYIFATKGYHDATIADIAKVAQYAVGTIYIYFKDKEELYLDLFEKKASELISMVKAETEKAETPHGKLKVLIDTQLGYFEENKNFYRIYFLDRGTSSWAIKDRISQRVIAIYMKLLDFMVELIKEAQDGGVVRKDVEPKRVAYVLSGMIRSAEFERLLIRQSRKEDLEKMTDFVLDSFLNGVSKHK